MRPSLPVMVTLLVAFVFGGLAAWVKGPGGADGLLAMRTAVGDMSAPWLLVAFFAGARYSRARAGAVLGLIATIVALIGFYLVRALMEDHSGRGFLADVDLVFSANQVYFQAGLISGPVFGALGAWWYRTRRLHALVVAGVLLLGEPIVLYASRLAHDTPGVYLGEFALGLTVVLLAMAKTASAGRQANRPGANLHSG